MPESDAAVSPTKLSYRPDIQVFAEVRRDDCTGIVVRQGLAQNVR
jgi:hypothetical protein